MNEPYNKEAFDPFDEFSLFKKNRFNIMVNDASEVQSTDYFFELNDEGEVLSVHSDELNTAGSGNIFLGTPTKKHA